MSATGTLLSSRPAGAAGAEPAWLGEIRRIAAGRFDASRWPTAADERWRRTDLSKFDLPSLLRDPPRTDASPPLARPPASGEAWAGLLRFRGARCEDSGLAADAARAGVLLVPLGGTEGQADAELEASLVRGLASVRDRIGYWHYRSWTHGALIRVPEGGEVAGPLVVEIDIGGPEPCLPRLLVRLAPSSRATVVVRVRGGSDPAALNGVVDLEIGEGAALRYVELHQTGPQCLVFWSASATVARDGKLEHTSAALGARLHRGEIDCALAGPGAEALLQGVAFATGTQHLDLLTVQRHLAPSASSRTLYKVAARDEAATVFQGLIDVAEGARGTDAYLANRNLLLGGTPRADSIPSLSIRNDDLRCSHGSTTGRIDPAERFYLMSRGLPREEADAMIVEGYFEEVISRVPDAVAQELREDLLRLLGSEA